MSSDDGVRLWVNGQILIDTWSVRGPATRKSSPLTLTAGALYSLRIESRERSGRAQVQMRWTPPGGQPTVIPSTHLIP
jgi:hypothetical protein